jgi:hypothetical protein
MRGWQERVLLSLKEPDLRGRGEYDCVFPAQPAAPSIKGLFLVVYDAKR